jgi:hypothetical protein
VGDETTLPSGNKCLPDRETVSRIRLVRAQRYVPGGTSSERNSGISSTVKSRSRVSWVQYASRMSDRETPWVSPNANQDELRCHFFVPSAVCT